jgi:hypothetical protein
VLGKKETIAKEIKLRKENTTMKKCTFIVIAAFILLLSGCATNQALVMPGKDFKSYKTAYIELLPEDEYNFGTFITYELTDMGFQIANKRITAPVATDMIVRYAYWRSWDFVFYLKKYQVIFLDAQTETIITNLEYDQVGVWLSARYRQIQGFNELRNKLGYPPSKMTE